MSLTQREPAVIIGVIATIILNSVLTLQGEGLISDALAGRITDLINALLPAVIAILPIVLAIITRFFVYSPASVAKLEAGGSVGSTPIDPMAGTH